MYQKIDFEYSDWNTAGQILNFPIQIRIIDLTFSDSENIHLILIPKKYVLVCCCGFTRKLSVLDRINRALPVSVCGSLSLFSLQVAAGNSRQDTRLACWNACPEHGRIGSQFLINRCVLFLFFFNTNELQNQISRPFPSSIGDPRDKKIHSVEAVDDRKGIRPVFSSVFVFLRNFYSDSHS